MLAPNAGQLTYENAAGDGVDVEYTVLPGRVKEAIILESPQDIVSYIMDITAEGLDAGVNESGEVVFSDGTEVIFTIWTPYMYDSADELSEDIELDLKDNGNGSYTVTLTPDAEWLNDEARVYPITIDPDVSAGTDQANGIDNSVEKGSGVITHTLDRLYAGTRNGKTRKFYQKFKTMPTIPSGATINSATQTFYVTSGTSTGNTFKAKRVAADWSSSKITWSNKPWTDAVIQLSISHNGLTKYNVNMTSTVRYWYSGSTTGRNKNYGIMVEYQNEDIRDFNTVYSADFATAAKRPQLKINYSGGSAPTPTPTPPQSGGPAGYLYYGKEYYIMNKHSGQYLTVQGTNVQQSKFSNSAKQRWKIVHAGNGESHLVSMNNQSYVLFISGNSANNDANVIVDTNKSASGSRFNISTNSDGVTYRILSTSSSYKKVVVVQGASCNVGQNVIQYSYNSTTNDEWFFVPVKLDVSLGERYARNRAERGNDHLNTFPWLYGEQDYGNFVSQCILAQGVRYRGKWYIYKKRDGSPDQMHSHVASSYWDYDVLSDSEMSPYGWTPYGFSPWFNATAFWAFWGPKVQNVAYTTSSIRPDSEDQALINRYYKQFYNQARSKFSRGDVVQIIASSSSWDDWGSGGVGTRSVKESMYIIDISTIDGHNDFLVARENEVGEVVVSSLKEVLEKYPRSDYVSCRFFRLRDAN